MIFILKFSLYLILGIINLMSYEQQNHLIKTTISLKKIAITVRFPCSITYSLKNQNSVIEQKSIYQLKKGESIINEQTSIESEVVFTNGKYDDKKVSLLIFMVSVNGKIPAGSVTLNACDNYNDKKLPLEKCPDRTAQVHLSQSFQLIKVIKKYSEVKSSRLPSGNLLAGSYLDSNEQFSSRNSKFKHSSSSNLLKSEIVQNQGGYFPDNPLKMSKMESSEISIDKSKRTIFRQFNSRSNINQDKINHSGDLNSQQGNFISTYQGISHKPTKSRLEQMKKSIAKTIQRDPSQSRLSRASSQVLQNKQEQLQNQKTKIHKLQQEKANYIKQITKLKSSNIGFDQMQKSYIEQQINKYRLKNDNLEDQVEKTKQKLKRWERKQAQWNYIQKELKEEVLFYKNKHRAIEIQKQNQKKNISQKEQQISHLENEIKKYQDEIQELKYNHLNIQKRLDLKQNSYKDQLKKLTQKYTQSQAERQKMILDYNALLSELQVNEKKQQNVGKQKQRGWVDEKIKMAKKIDYIQRELQLLNEELIDSKNKIKQIQTQNNRLLDELKQRDANLIDQKRKNQLSQYQLKQQQEKNKSLFQENQVQKSANEEKIQIKKKLNQNLVQIQSLKDKMQNSRLKNQQLEQKRMQLQEANVALLKQKSSLILKLNDMKRLYDQMVSEEQERERLTETLSTQQVSTQQKLNELKNQIQVQRKNFILMESKYEEQVQYLVKSRQELNYELNQNRQLLQKQQAKYTALNDQFKLLSQKLVELTHQNLKLEEKIAYKQQKLNEKELYAAEMQSQNEVINNKIKTLNDLLKKKEQEIYSLNKINKRIQQEMFILRQESSSQKYYFQNEVIKNKKQQQENYKKIKIKEIEISELKQENFKMVSQIESQTNLIRNKNAEISTFRNQIQKADLELSILTVKHNQLQKQFEEIQERNRHLQSNISAKISHISSSSTEIEQLKKVFQQFQTKNYQALQAFLQQIIMELQNYKIENSLSKNQNNILFSFPTQQLTNLILLSYQKIKIQIKKYRSFELQKSHLIKQLQNQLLKAQQKIKMKQSEFQIIKNEQKLQIKVLMDKNLKQVQFLKQSNTILQQKIVQYTSQIQYLHAQISKYEQNIDELNDFIKRCKEDSFNLKRSNEEYQNQIFELKENVIKIKSKYEDQISLLVQRTKLQKADQIQNHNTVEHLKNQLKRHLSKREEEIKISNQENYELSNANQLLKQTIARNQQVIQQQLANFERVSKENLKIQNQNTNLSHTIKQVTQQLNFLSFKKVQFQQKFKELSQEMNDKQNRILILEADKKQKQNIIANINFGDKQQKLKLNEQKRFLEKQIAQIQTKYQLIFSENDILKYQLQQIKGKLKEKEQQCLNLIQEVSKSKKLIVSLQNNHEKQKIQFIRLQDQLETQKKQQSNLLKENNVLKTQIQRLQKDVSTQQISQIIVQMKQKEINKLRQQVFMIEQRQQNNLSELKQHIADLKKQIANRGTKQQQQRKKIRQLEKIIENHNQNISRIREEWENDFFIQKEELKLKIEELEELVASNQQQSKFKFDQSIKQIETANGVIQELNQVIKEKQQRVQYFEGLLREMQIRNQEITIQLNECLQKWKTQKSIYVPTSDKMNEIDGQLSRMNKFALQFDGRSKQILQISKRKTITTIQSKPTLTQILKELTVLLNKNKSKILGRCNSDKEKQTVVAEFRVVQQKIQSIIKSSQSVMAKA